MKVLVTGVAGQLGHDCMNELAKRQIAGIGSDLKEEYTGIADGTAVTHMPYVQLDITDAEAVDKCIEEIHPDVVLHCAAWTAVDAGEEEENLARVEKINGYGTENIAKACQKIDAKLVYLSTDYVFDGQGDTPWKPENNHFAPLNQYGRTKLMGEQAILKYLQKYFIIRIAWVFGLSGKNFIRTMLQAGKNHPEVRVVSDQIGTPTYTLDLAKLLVDMLLTEKYGIYHATNSEIAAPDGAEADADGTKTGYISWYDFTREIYRQAGLSTRITPVTTKEYGLSKAVRPFNSRLDKGLLTKRGFAPLPTWKDALSRYLEELRKNGELQDIL